MINYMPEGISHAIHEMEHESMLRNRAAKEAAEKAAQEEAAKLEEALDHAKNGGHCLLLAETPVKAGWLPCSNSPASQQLVEAAFAARWAVENLPVSCWEPEHQYDLVCRYWVDDIAGMSGGKKGMKAMLADMIRQYKQGATDLQLEDQAEAEAEKDFSAADNRFGALAALLKK